MGKLKKATVSASKNPFTYKGVDLMGGPKINTTPTCPISHLRKIPQLGFNVGMDRHRP
jgi:hypothetical protein